MLLTHFLPFWEVTMKSVSLNSVVSIKLLFKRSSIQALPEDILKLYVKNNRDEMVPFFFFMHLEKVYGLSKKSRDTICTMLQK